SKSNPQKQKTQTEESQKNSNDGIESPSSMSDLQTGEGVTKVRFQDPSGAIMFRGTRGINLVKMEVGIPLNSSDTALLKDSSGFFVASGLRIGVNFNDWGMFVKSVKPQATVTTNFVERLSNCESDEIAIGLPDRGVDATQNNQHIVPGWMSRLICAKIAPDLKAKQIITLKYTHQYSMAVDCPGNSLLNGYDCGNCGVPSPAVLKCIEVEKK
ncbi:MAG: hypothetical protein NT027_06520, partial [Proteobacteria bacterium]|nr:hypothetical protein [Pseudomonadota bacterium]